jgi:predicted transcriptional regulator
MTVKEIADILGAEILSCENLANETEVHSAFGSDMMSDVLAFVKDQGLLLTGLVNPQVVRTTEMMDILCIAFVRGKRPDQMMIDLANQKGIILLTTTERMYPACGKLFMAGLESGKTA